MSSPNLQASAPVHPTVSSTGFLTPVLVKYLAAILKPFIDRTYLLEFKTFHRKVMKCSFCATYHFGQF